MTVQTVPMAGARMECHRCAGCGKVANDEEATPWTYWLDLPLGSALAVTMGLVKPVTCTLCDGTGRIVLLWVPDREWGTQAPTSTTSDCEAVAPKKP